MSFSASSRFARLLPWLAVAILALATAGSWASFSEPEPRHSTAEFWKVGKSVPIGVARGRAKFQVPSSGPRSECLVVVSALAANRGTFPIEMSARSVEEASPPALAVDEPGPARTIAPRAAAWPVSAPIAPITNDVSSLPAPPYERPFSMLVRDGDPSSASNYATVKGVLRGYGKTIQVYVAEEDIPSTDPELVKDLIITFDDRVHPLSARDFGVARDIDGDGRFTILISGWLGHLGGGRLPVDGFVRVADLDPAYRAPFGNQCDMMYLNASLKPGPHVRTVVAHEYMHAVIFSCKMNSHPLSNGPIREEEGWLDEAIAHLAEDVHGFSSSNIDYRVSAFLSNPEQYQLVVDDYYAANLFRSHGNRGSTYLFLRYCADRQGPDLLRALISSSRSGIANLESATGSSFASLYRRWSVATFLSGLDADADADQPDDASEPYRTVNLRSPREELDFTGPRFQRMSPDRGHERFHVASTASHYVIVDGARAGGVEIEVSGPPEADMQVTVVPLGDDHARLDLSIVRSRAKGGDLLVTAAIKERDGVPVRLSALSWEPLVPAANPHAGDSHRGRLDMLGVAASFGTSAIPAGGELRSKPIRLPGVTRQSGPIVVKVIGTDARGRRIAAWADLNDAPAGLEIEP
jgi:hypothetical protein